jgi:hypothetical protein
MTEFLMAMAFNAFGAIAWSGLGRRWAFHRLAEVAQACQVPVRHRAFFERAYRMCWHAGGIGFAALMSAAAAMAFLDWKPPAGIWIVSAGANYLGPTALALQSMPTSRRLAARYPRLGVLAWPLLAITVAAAWYFGKP